MSAYPVETLEQSLKRLKHHWPKPLPEEVGKIFEKAHACIRNLKQSNGESFSSGKGEFQFVELINQVLKAHDLLFLRRQLTYHLVATTDLPKAYGLREALQVLNHLITATARQARFGSKLKIQLEKRGDREAQVLWARFIYSGETPSDEERERVLEQLYGSVDKKVGEISGFASARRILKRVGGNLWLEFAKEEGIVFTFDWPLLEDSKKRVKEKGAVKHSLGTCKCEILLSDYSKIRRSFGIVRARDLVTQIETFVRTLVRHPIDMVAAFPSQGKLVAVYESQEGGASTILARISSRLQKETFRVGRRSVKPTFQYKLTTLI